MLEVEGILFIDGSRCFLVFLTKVGETWVEMYKRFPCLNKKFKFEKRISQSSNIILNSYYPNIDTRYIIRSEKFIISRESLKQIIQRIYSTNRWATKEWFIQIEKILKEFEKDDIR